MFRPLLWPSLVTLALSIVRLLSEVQGWVTTASGGRGLPLGISWLIFVLGGYWGHRLARGDAGPRVARAWSWPLVAMLAVVVTGLVLVRPLVGAPHSEATWTQLRVAVLAMAGVTTLGAVAMFFAWPRLALLLLLYAIPARATVVGIALLAKDRGWDTHYTKFGPMGMERDAAESLVAVLASQVGFWIPLTIVGGVLAGSLFARRRA
ncbi:MAG: hypothetical protein JNK15_04560 [Planctomycetes bacterium]|nr:hypothetical protein [Planctomycetota bacterium]